MDYLVEDLSTPLLTNGSTVTKRLDNSFFVFIASNKLKKSIAYVNYELSYVCYVPKRSRDIIVGCLNILLNVMKFNAEIVMPFTPYTTEEVVQIRDLFSFTSSVKKLTLKEEVAQGKDSFTPSLVKKSTSSEIEFKMMDKQKARHMLRVLENVFYNENGPNLYLPSGDFYRFFNRFFDMNSGEISKIVQDKMVEYGMCYISYTNKKINIGTTVPHFFSTISNYIAGLTNLYPHVCMNYLSSVADITFFQSFLIAEE